MDFDIASVDVVPATLAWGPYTFDFAPALPDPEGDPVVTVGVKTYRNGAETTSQLIDRTALAGSSVQVWFDYPGSQHHGKHNMVMTLTTQGGGVRSLQFGYVDVG